MCWSPWVPHTVVERSRDPHLFMIMSIKMNGSATADAWDQRKQLDSITGGIKGSLKLEIPAFPPVLEGF